MPEGYKQTEVGLIPQDWLFAKLENNIELLTGFPFPSNKYSKYGIKLLRGSNVKRGHLDWSDEITQYWPTITNEIKAYLLDAGDIVIAMDGSLVGKSFASLVSTDLPALLLQRVARIRSKSILQEYLKVFICSDYFTKHCDKVKTASAIPHISPEDIRSFKIAIPPNKTEQTAIAEALSDMDALIAQTEKLIEKKKAIKQGVMQELLSGRTRLAGFEKNKGYKKTELGVIPEDWEVRKLGEVGDVKMCRRIFNSETSENGRVPFYKIGTFGKDPDAYITWEKYEDYRRKYPFPRKGDILISAAGTIGRTVIYDGSDAYFQDSNIVWLDNNSKIVTNEFLHHIYQIVKYNTEGGTIQRLYNSILKSASFSCPPLNEQAAIAEALSDMDNEINLLETKQQKLQLYKQGMMQALLTGKIRLI